MIPRAKRTLTSLPLVLSLVSQTCLDKEWKTEDTLLLENHLEEKGLKKPGTKRDQGGSGGRTYRAWVEALGFIFKETATGFYRLTKAGEALVSGSYSPTEIATFQLMKMQYPSPYSTKSNVNVNTRFGLYPFRFLLQLLKADGIEYLTEEEIALYVITEGTSNSNDCVSSVAKKIISHRKEECVTVDEEFAEKFSSRVKGKVRTPEKTYKSLKDIANTFINHLEYTQIVSRDLHGKLWIKNHDLAEKILGGNHALAKFDKESSDKETERFQRKFGLGPKDTRDDRTFAKGSNIRGSDISKKLVTMAFHDKARWSILDVKDEFLIKEIAKETGLETTLVRKHLSTFAGKELDFTKSSYISMAFAGRREATDFEKATAGLMGENGLGFKASHVGGPGSKKEPDIYIVEEVLQVSGIIDTKAYSYYTISNDHQNRMVHNYIPKYKDRNGTKLKFFMYISGSFGKSLPKQLEDMSKQTGLGAIGMTAEEVLEFVISETIPNEKKRNNLIAMAQQKKGIVEAKDLLVPDLKN